MGRGHRVAPCAKLSVAVGDGGAGGGLIEMVFMVGVGCWLSPLQRVDENGFPTGFLPPLDEVAVVLVSEGGLIT